jgi:hypothetical protein
VTALEDKPDDLTAAIAAAHPLRTGHHASYARALELVGNRHSKGALVELVSYLLVQIGATAEAARAEERARVEAEIADLLTVEANAWRGVVRADCEGERALRQAVKKVERGVHRRGAP